MNILGAFKQRLAAFRGEEGSAFIDLVVKIGIGIVTASIIITFLRTTLPDLFAGLFTKIEQLFLAGIGP